MLKFDQDNYAEETFASISLLNQLIKDKEFENCVFENCTIIESTFSNCRFVESRFNNCNLSAIKFPNSRFSEVSFTDCKAIGFDWSVSQQTQLLSFIKCDVSYSNFSFLKLIHLKLIECIAKECSFSGADLGKSTLTDTDFEQSVFSNTNLSNADLRKAFNYGIDFSFNKLTKAKFSLSEAAALLKSLDIILE